MPSEKATDMTWFNDDVKKVQTRPSAPPPKTSEQNRRRHSRFEVPNSSVVLRKVGLMSALGLGNKGRTISDLSQSGARVRVTERLSPRDKVRLKIVLEKYQDEVEIAGEVRWCHATRKDDEFTVGIRFFGDDAAALRKMSRLQEWFTSHQYRSLRAK